MKLMAVFIALLSTTSLAWDGERKGFILGTGVGGGALMSSFSNVPDSSVESITEHHLLGTTRIGYAYNNFSSIEFYQEAYRAGFSYNGINFRQYLSEGIQANGWFAGVGIFLGTDNIKYKERDEADPKVDFALNAGYTREIVKHFHVDLTYAVGMMEDNFEGFLSVIGMTFTIVGY